MDPTELFQKHIQQTVHKYTTIIDKNQNKHLIQITHTAPKLNALIKIHEEDKTIGPVINNI